MRLLHASPSLPALALVGLLSGCGGVDVDTDALRDGFVDGAEAAYDQEDRSRAEDFAQGVITGCFALDERGVDAIAEALGTDGDLEEGKAPLYGPEDRESLTCTYLDDDGAPAFRVQVGTTDLDRDGVVEARTEGEDAGYDVEEGGVDGLDDEDVAVLTREGYADATFVRDGVLVVVGGQLGADAVRDALPVAVEELARVLG